MKRMKKIAIGALAFVWALCSSVCNAEGEHYMNLLAIVSENKPISELITHVYSEDELERIAKAGCSYAELDALYPIECLRTVGPDVFTVYIGNGLLLLVSFSLNGDYISSVFAYPQKTLGEFGAELIGQSYKDVMVFDKNGSYVSFYVSNTNIPLTSSHVTTDGYMVTLVYDRKTWCVIRMEIKYI